MDENKENTGAEQRVLIIEDETVIALDLKQQVERFGYTVCGIAADSDTALRLASETKPDLALVDIVLSQKGITDGPGQNGITVGDYLYKKLAIPVIYVTAYNDPEMVKLAQQTKPYGFLLKPFNENELKIMMDYAIRKGEEDRFSEELVDISMTLFDLCPTPYLILRNNMIVYSANTAFCQFLGIQKEKIKGKNISDILDGSDINKILPVLQKEKEYFSSSSGGRGSDKYVPGRGRILFEGDVVFSVPEDIILHSEEKDKEIQGGCEKAKIQIRNIVTSLFRLFFLLIIKP
ncbi:MAG: response regulator [Thermoplasmata archaeon]